MLYYTDLTGTLGSLTVTGDQKLSLNVTSHRLDVLDASGHSGGLTVSTASLANMGTLTLGQGTDTVNIASTSSKAGIEAIAGLEKTSDAALGINTVAAQAAILAADTLVLSGGVVAGASTVTGGAVSARGVLTFSGAAPANLDNALLVANLAADSANEILVFGFQGDSYVFMQGSSDVIVKLVGVTGVTAIAETGTDAFYIV